MQDRRTHIERESCRRLIEGLISFGLQWNSGRVPSLCTTGIPDVPAGFRPGLASAKRHIEQ